MSIRKNVAGQHLPLGTLRSATDGSAVTSGAAAKVSQDGGATGTSSGTLTHVGEGAWDYEPTQGETDCDSLLVTLTKSGAIPISVGVITVDYPRDAIPAVAANASGGLITSGTGTGQLSVTGGRAKADATYLMGTALTETSAGYLAAGLSQFFDVVTPTTDMNDVGTGGSGAPSASDVATAVWGAVTRTITGGTITTVSDKTGYSLTQAFPTNFADLAITETTGLVSTGDSGALTDATTEPVAVPSATASLADKLNFACTWIRNKRTQSNSTQTLYADDGTTVIATSAITDASSLTTVGEWTT